MISSPLRAVCVRGAARIDQSSPLGADPVWLRKILQTFSLRAYP
jgi:hypothetical protein